MKAWKYHHGEWSEIEDPMVWNEGEDSKTAFKRAGYYTFPFCRFGVEEGQPSIELYAKEDYGPPWLVNLNITDAIEYIYIYDLPSLMQFLRDYAPMCSLSQMADIQEEQVSKILSRAFQAWHGHDFDNVCPRCDPLEFKRREQARQRRMEKRRPLVHD